MTLIIKRNLAEAVAEKLREQISAGQYAVGDQLPIEPELMKSFGVGRSSIREAIKILSIQGLLEVQQGLGTFVRNTACEEPLSTQLSRSQLEDIVEVRSLLEVRIAEKAAVHRSIKQLKVMCKWLSERQRYAQQNEVQRCIEADVNFHTAIAEACGNTLLTDLYKATSVEVTKSLMSRHSTTTAFLSSQLLHQELYRAIEMKDTELAAARVRAIINNH